MAQTTPVSPRRACSPACLSACSLPRRTELELDLTAAAAAPLPLPPRPSRLPATSHGRSHQSSQRPSHSHSHSPHLFSLCICLTSLLFSSPHLPSRAGSTAASRSIRIFPLDEATLRHPLSISRQASLASPRRQLVRTSLRLVLGFYFPISLHCITHLSISLLNLPCAIPRQQPPDLRI